MSHGAESDSVGEFDRIEDEIELEILSKLFASPRSKARPLFLGYLGETSKTNRTDFSRSSHT
jgi:hypothetical protein